MAASRSKPAAVVTGAESGIGRATAIALSDNHDTIGLTWLHSEEAANAVADEVMRRGSRAIVAYLDLADVGGVQDAVTTLLDRTGPLDVLVNNAAMPFSRPFLECERDETEQVFDVNFFGPFFVSRIVAHHMIEHEVRGAIVNVTSVQQERVNVGSTVYACAKAALAQLSRSTAVELADHGIRVISVAPGEIATGMSTIVDAETVRPSIPLRRAGRADEVATLIRFLASPESAYVTGANVVCDGGLTLPLPSD